MNRLTLLLSSSMICTVLVACGDEQPGVINNVAAQERQAPRFEVDPFWPKPLPNHWVMGMTIGVSVDSRDHVWIIHRQNSLNERTEASAGVNTQTGECCSAAPPVLEFDAEGNLVGSWGGPGDGYDWPQSNHGITVDHMDNIWIGGNGEHDAHLLKFTRAGQFLMQLGSPGANSGSLDEQEDGAAVYIGGSSANSGSNSTENFGRVAKISIDAAANEAYVADGYLNKRVAVLDMDTGEMKRYWGAYGNRPDDADLGLYDPDAPPAQQFRNPVHCAEPTPDGLVYVCDRQGDRIQVFRKDGSFVRELFVAPLTLGSGSVWDIAFSKDPDQTYIYLADGLNEKVYIILRETMEVLTAFGDGGRQPGQFFGVHSIATDSAGNIYTTETYEGRRVQKFLYQGFAPIPAEYQGVVWPERRD